MKEIIKAKPFKPVHMNLKLDEHSLLTEKAASLGMPVATYAKAVVLAHLQDRPLEIASKEPEYVRKPRTIKRNR